MDSKEFTIDGIRYVLKPANAISAWNALKKAGVLLNGLSMGSDQEGAKSVAMGAILSNLGDPVVKDIENLIYSHTCADIDGKVYLLSDNMKEHFNQYRSHIIPVLIEGAMYQFEDFFKGGMSSLSRLMPQTPPQTGAAEKPVN